MLALNLTKRLLYIVMKIQINEKYNSVIKQIHKLEATHKNCSQFVKLSLKNIPE